MSTRGMFNLADDAILRVFCACYEILTIINLKQQDMLTCLSMGASIISTIPSPTSNPTAPSCDLCACLIAFNIFTARTISCQKILQNYVSSRKKFTHLVDWVHMWTG
jgi:hypothetical protein